MLEEEFYRGISDVDQTYGSGHRGPSRVTLQFEVVIENDVADHDFDFMDCEDPGWAALYAIAKGDVAWTGRSRLFEKR